MVLLETLHLLIPPGFAHASLLLLGCDKKKTFRHDVHRAHARWFQWPVQ